MVLTSYHLSARVVKPHQIFRVYEQFLDFAGERLRVFNSMSQLYIGGGLSPSGEIQNSFHGLVSGLNFNSVNVLDLAKGNDGTITIHGDARLTDLNDDR